MPVLSDSQPTTQHVFEGIQFSFACNHGCSCFKCNKRIHVRVQKWYLAYFQEPLFSHHRGCRDVCLTVLKSEILPIDLSFLCVMCLELHVKHSWVFNPLTTVPAITRLLQHDKSFSNRRILQKDRCTEVIQCRENFACFCANTCDIVCKEDLKHFHSFLLGNEEDPKGLLNIKQEFLSNYLLHLIVARMWQVVSLQKRKCGNEWLSAMLIPVVPDSGLKVLFTLQVWARLFCRSMYFFVFVFSYLLYECVPCNTGRCQTLSTSGTRTLI